MAEVCAMFEVSQPDVPGGKGVIYVKSRWFDTNFSLLVTDGLNAWSGDGSEEEVSARAVSWDCTVSEYMQTAKQYLGFQDKNSTYSFSSQGHDARKLSWTFVRDEVELVATWKVKTAPNPKEVTCEVLNFLMMGSSRISEELQRLRRSFEQLQAEAGLSSAQSKRFRDDKIKFEEEIFKKFVAVLNSKKAKIRDLKEQLLRAEGGKPKTEKEEEVESEDEYDYDTDREDDAQDDNDSRGDTEVETTETGADADSGATEILAADSPMEDVSSVNPGHCNSPPRDLDLKAPSAEPVTEVTDAAALLSGPTYTSAPRKRRHQ